MKKKIIILTVSAMLVLITSCASFKSIFKEPEMSFDSVKISGISFNAMEFIFKYKIDNPNAVSLELSSFKYDLFVDNNKFISGVSPSPLSIKKEGSSFVEIPVAIEYKELFNVYKGLASKNSADYRIESEFTVDLPVFGSKVFPLKHEGTFPVLKMPEVTFESFKALSITPFSALLELSVNIVNKNSFAISPDSFNFDFSVNNSQWMKGIIKNIEEMAPGKSAKVKIPVEINPSKVGNELFDFIFNGKGLDLVLDGNVSLRTAYPGFASADVPFRIEKSTSVAK
ncbi:MAG: LEA type 2 family protein [Spirochaetia bacterium]|jgi:LEA14-like dessication related protein|nr:LEA type 2 family protein [Spirochaetia bacterium]